MEYLIYGKTTWPGMVYIYLGEIERWDSLLSYRFMILKFKGFLDFVKDLDVNFSLPSVFILLPLSKDLESLAIISSQIDILLN